MIIKISNPIRNTSLISGFFTMINHLNLLRLSQRIFSNGVKFIFSIAIISAVSLLAANSACAQEPNELVVDFQEMPLFNSVTNFLPGDAETRWAKITNNSGQKQKIGVKIIDKHLCSADYCLSDKLNLDISENGNLLYSGSLTTFYEMGEIHASDLENGADTTYNFSIIFFPNSGDDYQGLTANFDIEIGFFGQESIGEEIQPGGGGGGGGGVIISGLMIYNEQASNIEANNVTITWLTNLDSTSRVIYSPGGFPHLFNSNNPPNYGYVLSTVEKDLAPRVTGHSVYISGLLPATTYYFRCVSRASPATIGFQYSFTTPAEDEGIKVLGEAGAPNLTISKTVNVGFANPGDTVIYKTDITNIGNIIAYNAILTDILPAGFTFSEYGTAFQTWELGDIEPGQAKTAEYSVDISSDTGEGIYTNLAQVSADGIDPISASADLEVRKPGVLGIELAPTGFNIKEFIILILTFIMLAGSAVMLRKRYLFNLEK
ncbi:DUF11 domain-containing protein [Patescibacteria group bacterium]|nr:DUF11 domain-containing protein [Patescibacteria group bacterium]MBU4600644.1 DUF11 domain-containing protein [Patescibacteria group bacterium]MCG2698563.1 hypothetical protein [Candidatus Parcubacteria bacterium]